MLSLDIKEAYQRIIDTPDGERSAKTREEANKFFDAMNHEVEREVEILYQARENLPDTKQVVELFNTALQNLQGDLFKEKFQLWLEIFAYLSILAGLLNVLNLFLGSTLLNIVIALIGLLAAFMAAVPFLKDRNYIR